MSKRRTIESWLHWRYEQQPTCTIRNQFNHLCPSKIMKFNERCVKRWVNVWRAWQCNTETWWRHQMETFSALLALCAGYRWISLINASDAELWCFLWSAPWINGWINNREAGELRRHRAHYDAIGMNLILLIRTTHRFSVLIMLILIYVCLLTLRDPGGRLNKKDGLTRYGNSHVKDKTS